MPRDINDVLNFRNDFSPFLTHLTRDKNGVPARDVLEKIINDGFLECSDELISAAQYGTKTADMSDQTNKRFFLLFHLQKHR